MAEPDARAAPARRLTPLLYGVGAAVGWGLADYAGALSTRRLGVFGAMLGMQVTGTVLYAATLVAVGRFPALTIDQLPLALGLSALGLAGLILFYKALALGPIAIVSPIGAAYVAVTVVLVVVFLGERLSLGQTVAIIVTTIGIVMTATDGRSLATALGRPKPGVWLAVLAMIAFGGWAALMAYATREHDGLAMILMQRLVSVPITLAILVALRRPLPVRLDGRMVAIVLATGIFDTLANVLYVQGVQGGYASVVATGSGVYPIIPALLAVTMLGERLAPNQYAGVLVLLAGLVGLGAAGP
ncbi:MAG: DMT family transporter [Candidatus Limnocylindria bacterium]